MKILFYINNLSSGGAERTVSYLSNYFSKMHHEVTIVLNSNNIFYDIDENINIHVLHINKSNRIMKIIKRIILFKKTVKQLQPDIMVCLLYTTIFYTLFTNRKIKVFGSERSNPKNNNYLENGLKKFLFKRTSGMIFQTIDAQNLYPKKIRDKSIVIPNAIGNELINTIHINDISERKKVICAVGRLSESKDYKTLLNAFNIVSRKFPNYKLLIYGEGEQKDYLINYTKKLELSDNVVFCGVDKDLIIKIYDASCYVLSSKSEGMPNSLIEALAIGLPCVSTDCDFGPRDLIIDNYNGKLVPVGDALKLSEAIIYMLENREFAEKCSSNAKKIRDRLSIEKIANKYLNFILGEEKNERIH